MKIQGKILFCLSCVFLLLLGAIGLTYKATEKVSYFRKRSLKVEAALIATTGLRAQVRNQLLETFDVLFVSGIDEEERVGKGKAEIEKKFEALKNSLHDLEATLGNVRESRLFEKDLQDVEVSYVPLQRALDVGIRLAKAGKVKEARSVLVDAREDKFEKRFIKEITDIIDGQTRASQEESRNLEASIASLKSILGVSLALAVLVIFGLSAFIVRPIGWRLSRIETAAEEISAGKLEIFLDERGSDEVAMLARSMNQMARSLDAAQMRVIKQQELLAVTSKMSSLGEMAGGIAHEINNPIAVIKIRAEQLRDCIEDDDIDRASVGETCDVIVNTCNRIAKIITGLRSFSRDGRGDPFQPASIQAIVDDTLAFCQEKFRNNGVFLELNLSSAPLILECRATQVSQVLLNLVGNSFDAIQGLQEKWVRVEGRDLGDGIELSVTDSGGGIPKEIRKKLTQPFFTTKEIGKGTGLGLSISRGIIESHGGRFSIDEACPNTRFVVFLPKKQKTSERERATA